MKKDKKVIFVNSHPIQYFAPLYQYMVKDGVDMEVWYCSDESIRGDLDKEFGVKVKWDLPLLDGYKSTFFKNYSFRKGIHKGFFGLMNFGLLWKVFRTPKSIFVVHGWQFFTYFMVIFAARLAGHKVAIRAEMPYHQEVLSKGIQHKFFKHFFFKIINFFLYIGTENKKYYEWLNVPERKLIHTPYSVDNARFSAAYATLKNDKEKLRKDLGLPIDATIILYSGKYINKKRPLDLLNAYSLLQHPKKALILMGEGELRTPMEAVIKEKKLEQVYLTGFINQSDILSYYAVADIFVMCSEVGETWGLSVNEAMCFALPIVVSDLTGSSGDLVVEGQNGFTFPTGNIEALANCLEKLLADDAFRASAGLISAERIQHFSYKEITEGIKKMIAIA